MAKANRVNKFHGNVPAWLKLAEVQVDYFSQFVKAWIPFNAWFSTCYMNENNDRDIINRIKRETNDFRDKIITHFRLTDEESINFINTIGRLHFELENSSIPSNDNRISFTNVVIEKNAKLKDDAETKGKKYKVIVEHKPNAPQGTQKVNVKVILLNGYKVEWDWDQNEYDLEELTKHPKYISIGTPKDRTEIQSTILFVYKEVNPVKPANLLLSPIRRTNGLFKAPADCITIDGKKNTYFINDPEKVAKALIEILYRLRNALFHGEINPTEDVQKIYREAYYIMFTLIKILK